MFLTMVKILSIVVSYQEGKLSMIRLSPVIYVLRLNFYWWDFDDRKNNSDPTLFTYAMVAVYSVQLLNIVLLNHIFSRKAALSIGLPSLLVSFTGLTYALSGHNADFVRNYSLQIGMHVTA